MCQIKWKTRLEAALLTAALLYSGTPGAQAAEGPGFYAWAMEGMAALGADFRGQTDPVGTGAFSAGLMAVLEGEHSAELTQEEHLMRLFMRGWLTPEELERGTAVPVTRLEACRLLAQALELPMGEETSPFADAADGWATAIFRLGLMPGRQEGGLCYLDPEKPLSPEEAAAVLWKTARLLDRPGTHAEPPEEPEPTPEPTPQPTPAPPEMSGPRLPSVPELSLAEKRAVIQNGAAYPYKLKRFAQKYDQVVDFVYLYPKLKDQRPLIDLRADAASGQVPLFIQWDVRWGYIPFGDCNIGQSGCGPVCLSMAAVYLNRDPYWSPDRVCRYTMDAGYYVMGQGSSWSLMSQGCRNLGMISSGVERSEAAMKQQLDWGRPIVASVQPGDFTKSGHFILIVGYDRAGFRVHDPNNPANCKSWTYSVLIPQIRAMWAMRKA